MIPLSSSNFSMTVVAVEVGGGTLSSADTEPEPIAVRSTTAVEAAMVRRFDIFRQ